MTWLYVPNVSTSSPSAQAEEGSTSESSWQFQTLARSCWWRGKPSPSRTWSQRWKRASWLQRLCGVMPEPSTAARGAESWMASLAASRANLTALPAARAGSSTSGTCGAQRAGSSDKHARGSFSSRTSPGCSRQGLTTSLAPREFGETYSAWVSRLRADWSRRRKLARRMSGSASLSSAWPTPAARDHKGANGPEHLQNGSGRLHLDQLPNFVAHCWPTACVTDANGARNLTSGRSDPDSKHHSGVTLNDAIRLYSLQDRVTSKDGVTSSPQRRTLNPRFVAWLMGWPQPASTGCGFSETGFTRWRRQMQFALSSIASPTAAPPAQSDLFA